MKEDRDPLITLNAILLVIDGVLYVLTGEVLLAIAMVISLSSILYLTWINTHEDT